MGLIKIINVISQELKDTREKIKALWDKLIAFYAFAAETNSNFAGYPKDYWSMFNQHVGYSGPDWDTYLNGYNAKCEAENRTADKLTKEEFNHATWREKIVYLAP